MMFSIMKTGTIMDIIPKNGPVPAMSLKRRIVTQLDEVDFPEDIIVSLYRNGPRPYHAGAFPGLHQRLPVLPGGGVYLQNPSVKDLRKAVKSLPRTRLKKTGYEEISLVSIEHNQLHGASRFMQ
jgi:hypothetical protein